MEKIVKLLQEVQKIKVKKEADNPFFKSKYMKLDDIVDAVTPILNKNACVAYHYGKNDGFIYTRITDGKDFIESCLEVKGDDPQKIGASTTYYRRYNLCLLLDILADEDDDGNMSSGMEYKKAARPVQQAAKQVSNPPIKKTPTGPVEGSSSGVTCKGCKQALTKFKTIDKFPNKLIYECDTCKNDAGYPLSEWVDK